MFLILFFFVLLRLTKTSQCCLEKMSLASSLQNGRHSTNLGSSLSAKAFALVFIWMTFFLLRRPQTIMASEYGWLHLLVFLARVYDRTLTGCYAFLLYLLGWESDLAAILLLLHLLPPTAKGKVHGKISAANAADHVIKFMKVCFCMLHFPGMQTARFLAHLAFFTVVRLTQTLCFGWLTHRLIGRTIDWRELSESSVRTSSWHCKDFQRPWNSVRRLHFLYISLPIQKEASKFVVSFNALFLHQVFPYLEDNSNCSLFLMTPVSFSFQYPFSFPGWRRPLLSKFGFCICVVLHVSFFKFAGAETQQYDTH